MGRPELSADERFVDHRARGEHQDELEAIVGEWAARYDVRELDRILNEAGVVVGPVYTIEDVFADPHFRARRMIVDHDDPEIGRVAGPNVAPRFSQTPGSVRWSGPVRPGSHNGEVYGDLIGLDGAELEELTRAGVI